MHVLCPRSIIVLLDGINDYASIDAVQNRSIRYFLGVHRFAHKVAINGDVGWLPSKERRSVNMV